MMADYTHWEDRFETFLNDTMQGDNAHDLEHIRRVVANARNLAATEHADLMVVLPAAWLHDCVTIPKDSPLRSQASQFAATTAVRFLQKINYPPEKLPAIEHAIAAHSFSANITPTSIEAKVVQDADRLDSLGAIGVARCLMLGVSLGRRLYDPDDPFADEREPDDQINTVDHFYRKLLRLAGQMQTAAGRAEAQQRSAFMESFLNQLRQELPNQG